MWHRLIAISTGQTGPAFARAEVSGRAVISLVVMGRLLSDGESPSFLPAFQERVTLGKADPPEDLLRDTASG